MTDGNLAKYLTKNAELERLLREGAALITEQERLVRGAQSRVLELRAALCLVLLDLEGELPGGREDPPPSARAARATLGLGLTEDIPPEWYKGAP